MVNKGDQVFYFRDFSNKVDPTQIYIPGTDASDLNDEEQTEVKNSPNPPTCVTFVSASRQTNFVLQQIEFSDDEAEEQFKSAKKYEPFPFNRVSDANNFREKKKKNKAPPEGEQAAGRAKKKQKTGNDQPQQPHGGGGGFPGGGGRGRGGGGRGRGGGYQHHDQHRQQQQNPNQGTVPIPTPGLVFPFFLLHSR